jgi:hypothetical protein
MPQAGWCKECGEWIWVDEQGGCQHGHGPECVESVHEQEEPAESEPRYFGVGEPLPSLQRFNWGAFFLPLFWGAVYGSWQILGVWMLALLSPLLVGSLLGTGQEVVAATAVVGVTVVAEVVAGVARLWAGLNANRLVWAREALRLEFIPESKPRFTVERFVARQRVWTIWGAVIMGTSSLVAVPFTAQVWREYGLTYVGAAMPIMWLVMEVGLGLWLDYRLRAEPADRGPSSER